MYDWINLTKRTNHTLSELRLDQTKLQANLGQLADQMTTLR